MYRQTIATINLLLLIGFSLSSNIQPDVTQVLKNGGSSGVIVQCQDTSTAKRETSLIKDFTNKIQTLVSTTANTRTDAVGELLNGLLNQQQSIIFQLLAPVINLLEEHNVYYKVIWTPLIIILPVATWPVVVGIAELDVVLEIRLVKNIPVDFPSPSEPTTEPRPPITGNSTWELGLTDARCKSIEILGNGTLIGVIDSGVLWNHTELKSSYKNDSYSWYDVINPGTSQYPVDVTGHGTFVTSNAVGSTLGVAPNAKWMACNLCESNQFCPDAAILECMQYMATPWQWDDTSVDKKTKNASKRPHVVNISYYTGIGGSNLMYPSQDPFYKMTEYLNSLGIVTVYAGGNFGPGCGSMAMPADFPIALAVGAVDRNATIGYFSSRGPTILAELLNEDSISTRGASVTLPPSLVGCTNSTLEAVPITQIIKPDIVAPGDNVKGALYTGVNEYEISGGTSFAAPYVSGVVLLMVSTNVDYPWNYKNIYDLLITTADTSLIDLKGVGPTVSKGSYAKASNIFCNFWSSGICNGWPNNVYGNGLVYTCKAVEAAKKYTKTHPAPKQSE